MLLMMMLLRRWRPRRQWLALLLRQRQWRFRRSARWCGRRDRRCVCLDCCDPCRRRCRTRSWSVRSFQLGSGWRRGHSGLMGIRRLILHPLLLRRLSALVAGAVAVSTLAAAICEELECELLVTPIFSGQLDDIARVQGVVGLLAHAALVHPRPVTRQVTQPRLACLLIVAQGKMLVAHPDHRLAQLQERLELRPTITSSAPASATLRAASCGSGCSLFAVSQDARSRIPQGLDIFLWLAVLPHTQGVRACVKTDCS